MPLVGGVAVHAKHTPQARGFYMENIEERPINRVVTVLAETKGGLIDRKTEILRRLELEAMQKFSVTIEGPPLYLWPPKSKQFKSLQWESEDFQGGWEFVQALTGRLPEHKTHQYILLDDLNYLPEDTGNSGIERYVERLRRSSNVIAESAIFLPESKRIKKFSESELSFKTNTTICSELDAAFNVQKIIDQLGSYGGYPLVYPGNIETTMNVVVNPDTAEIRAEQLNMFGQLYKQLRSHEAYERYSKDLTRKAITETYRHVWVGEKGNIKGITRPVFVNNNFSFVNR